jgi:phage I-like protein
VIEELPNGEFQASDGRNTLGPYRSRETAEAAQRMLNAFDSTDLQIQQITKTMKGEPDEND